MYGREVRGGGGVILRDGGREGGAGRLDDS